MTKHYRRDEKISIELTAEEYCVLIAQLGNVPVGMLKEGVKECIECGFIPDVPLTIRSDLFKKLSESYGGTYGSPIKFKPKKISTREEALAWAEKNPDEIVNYGGSLRLSFDCNFTAGLEKYEVLLSQDEEGARAWARLTAMEVVDE